MFNLKYQQIMSHIKDIQRRKVILKRYI